MSNLGASIKDVVIKYTWRTTVSFPLLQYNNIYAYLFVMLVESFMFRQVYYHLWVKLYFLNERMYKYVGRLLKTCIRVYKYKIDSLFIINQSIN